jgi:hypothetical protein
MELYGPAKDLVGSDIEWPEFDPWQFTKDISEEKLFWYSCLPEILNIVSSMEIIKV